MCIFLLRLSLQITFENKLNTSILLTGDPVQIKNMFKTKATSDCLTAILL
jgi:hypothetical protein